MSGPAREQAAIGWIGLGDERRQTWWGRPARAAVKVPNRPRPGGSSWTRDRELARFAMAIDERHAFLTIA